MKWVKLLLFVTNVFMRPVWIFLSRVLLKLLSTHENLPLEYPPPLRAVHVFLYYMIATDFCWKYHTRRLCFYSGVSFHLVYKSAIVLIFTWEDKTAAAVAIIVISIAADLSGTGPIFILYQALQQGTTGIAFQVKILKQVALVSIAAAIIEIGLIPGTRLTNFLPKTSSSLHSPSSLPTLIRGSSFDETVCCTTVSKSNISGTSVYFFTRRI